MVKRLFLLPHSQTSNASRDRVSRRSVGRSKKILLLPSQTFNPELFAFEGIFGRVSESPSGMNNVGNASRDRVSRRFVGRSVQEISSSLSKLIQQTTMVSFQHLGRKRWITQKPVSRGLFIEVMRGYQFQGKDLESLQEILNDSSQTLPMVGMNFDDVQEFINRINRFLPNPLRLPTRYELQTAWRKTLAQESFPGESFFWTSSQSIRVDRGIEYRHLLWKSPIKSKGVLGSHRVADACLHLITDHLQDG